eukprot:CAMPEP_0194272662 /NCGR_PEP_ID=MMETSP0169-20130528/6161_1 /TAXON_ID=218684 /ORGANISM="Corethron pennatum, Strain L29A3" /LENGTH=755 /DNA_ID=CAMNT_0039015377 /DNA_START=143 /DNA_END=2410 /DNA_ORIENTATION=-
MAKTKSLPTQIISLFLIFTLVKIIKLFHEIEYLQAYFPKTLGKNENTHSNPNKLRATSGRAIPRTKRKLLSNEARASCDDLNSYSPNKQLVNFTYLLETSTNDGDSVKEIVALLEEMILQEVSSMFICPERHTLPGKLLNKKNEIEEGSMFNIHNVHMALILEEEEQFETSFQELVEEVIYYIEINSLDLFGIGLKSFNVHESSIRYSRFEDEFYAIQFSFDAQAFFENTGVSDENEAKELVIQAFNMKLEENVTNLSAFIKRLKSTFMGKIELFKDLVIEDVSSISVKSPSVAPSFLIMYENPLPVTPYLKSEDPKPKYVGSFPNDVISTDSCVPSSERAQFCFVIHGAMTFYDGQSFQDKKLKMYHAIKLSLEKGLGIQQDYPELIKTTYIDQLAYDMFDPQKLKDTVTDTGKGDSTFVIEVSLLIAACMFAVMLLGIKVVERNKAELPPTSKQKKRTRKKKLFTAAEKSCIIFDKFVIEALEENELLTNNMAKEILGYSSDFITDPEDFDSISRLFASTQPAVSSVQQTVPSAKLTATSAEKILVFPQPKSCTIIPTTDTNGTLVNNTGANEGLIENFPSDAKKIASLVNNTGINEGPIENSSTDTKELATVVNNTATSEGLNEKFPTKFVSPDPHILAKKLATFVDYTGTNEGSIEDSPTDAKKLATLVNNTGTSENLKEKFSTKYVSPDPYNLAKVHSANDVHKCASCICIACRNGKNSAPFFTPTNSSKRSTLLCNKIIKASVLKNSNP